LCRDCARLRWPRGELALWPGLSSQASLFVGAGPGVVGGGCQESLYNLGWWVVGGGWQESLYNLARAFHHVGLLHLAVDLYEQVLATPPASRSPAQGAQGTACPGLQEARSLQPPAHLQEQRGH